MTDFRHADNPAPFTDMTLERDPGELTQEERTAIRQCCAELQRLASRLYGDVPRLDRGAAASDLNRMAEAIRRARGKLLEFPDKPAPEEGP